MRVFRSRAVLRLLASVPAILVSFTACASGGRPSASMSMSSPDAAAAELFAIDRAFGAAAPRTDLITALANTFATDVVMPLPGGRLVSGLGYVMDALRSDTTNERSRVEWTPIRAGISADAQHGFTYGYTTTTRPDGARVPGKYLAYWVRSPRGWRVAAYKRAPRPAGEVSLAERSPAVPPRLAEPGDASARERYAGELADAERAFSRDAQTMGLGPAFVRYAAPDAMNIGGMQSAEFLFGPETIGQHVGTAIPDGTTITWAPDSVRVASSGDLGVTIGFITITAPANGTEGTTQRVPFFTVWRRDGPGSPWRFVAE